jgi:hypothetical protein
MEWATFAVIAVGSGYAFYDRHPGYGLVGLLLLAIYSRRGVLENAVARISHFTVSHGKLKFKVERDIRDGLERMMTSAEVSPVMKKEIFKLIAKLPLIEQQPAPHSAPKGAKYITADAAIDIVHDHPDVQAFEKAVPRVVYIPNGPQAYAVPGAEHETYLIQVAENLPDHLATFDWFYVDAVTGAIVGRGA